MGIVNIYLIGILIAGIWCYIETTKINGAGFKSFSFRDIVYVMISAMLSWVTILMLIRVKIRELNEPHK